MNTHLQHLLRFIEQDKSLTGDKKATLLKLVKQVTNKLDMAGSEPDQPEKAERSTAILLEETTKELEQKRKEVATQARELEIEAALEQVRSRSLAMHQSEELTDVVAIVFQKLKDLHISATAVGIDIPITGSKALNAFVCGEHKAGLVVTTYRLPFFDNVISRDLYNALEKQLEFYVGRYSQDDKKAFYEYLFDHSAIKDVPAEIKRLIFESPTYAISMIAVKNAVFTINDFEGKDLTENEVDIIKRFARVFDQAYTRFLDLQKAETQAQEAQIEAALERVRSRSLSMHHTSEIQAVIHTVHNELLRLNLSISGGSFIVINNDIDNELYAWGAGATAETTTVIHVPNFGLPFCTNLIRGIKRGPGFFTEEFSHPEKVDYFTELFNHEPWSKIPDNEKELVLQNEGVYTRSVCISTYTSIFIVNQNGRKFTAEENDILSRFSKVFEQSYVRFIDLQKAEAQAREAQIEAALEKVRSSSLAMHHSTELEQVAGSLFDRLVELGLSFDGALIIVFDKVKRNLTLWVATNHLSAPAKIDLPYDKAVENNTILKDFWIAIANGEPIINRTYSGEVKNEYFRYVAKYNQTTIPEAVRQFHLEQENWTTHFAVEKNSMIGFDSWSGHPTKENDFKILLRFAKVFEQAYTRFLDLQRAESQAREAQIELALERVRAGTMAMHKSEEVMDVAGTLFQELKKLGFAFGASSIIIMDKKSGDAEYWMAGFSKDKFPESYRVKYFQHPYNDALLAEWKTGKIYIVYHLAGDEKKAYDEVLFSQTGYKNIPEEELKLMRGIESVTFSIAFMKHGALHWGPTLLNEEQANVLQRFAKVFEQSYTRFLDLQKAEAQIRESQIQLALERVRARTMAMQHSDELADASFVLDSQVRALGIKTRGCAFTIYGESDSTEWFSSEHGSLPTYKTPREHFFLRFYEAGQRGEKILIETYEGEVCKEHYAYLCTLPVVGDALKEMIANGGSFPEKQIDHVVYFKYGYLLFITLEEVPEAHDVFKRFAQVFEQTYTRFLDLQKAEAQTREAQIEAALERVRAKTMAMQRSGELAEAASLLFHQVKVLGIAVYTAGFTIWDEKIEDLVSWACNADGSMNPPFSMPYKENDWHYQQYKSWKNGEVFIVKDFNGESMKAYFQYLRSFPLLDKAFKISIAAGHPMPERQVHNVVNFSYGNLLFITYVPVPEAHDIFKRFGKVFEQTYTRFLDLQKAEAQVREAQIEAALENVRSRSLAMQKSTELRDVVSTVVERMIDIGLNIASANIVLFDEHSKDLVVWTKTTKDDTYSKPFSLPYNDGPAVADWFDAFGRRAPLFTKSYTFDEKNAFWHNAFDYSDFRNVPDDRKKFILEAKHFSISLACRKNTAIQLTRYIKEPFSEADNEILKRFATVFEQAYTRFLDLQKAEAQALDVLRRTTVDRVRAEIASMRTTGDLERITPLIWNELTTLGVPFIRCGVFIMDEEQQQIHTFLSSPDGKAIASFSTPFSNPGLLSEALPHWRDKEIYKTHWDESTFVAQAQTLIGQGVISSPEIYLTEHKPTSLYLHLLPFLQGMLYVGSETAPLTNDQLGLVQTLADAFSTAYARYEDFNQLEAAKERVESTLTELKSTQAQLIQKEKLASLGELTAGIAHEIQNPLNFVNNFSEVSAELVAELQEEHLKPNRDTELEAELLGDIKQNLQKINHHGKRADAIVKGMLQHSRKNSGQKEPTDLNALADEYLRLAFHGLKAKDKTFQAKLKTDFDPALPPVRLIPQDLGRVLLNLINNALYAVNQRQKNQPLAGAEPTYEPTVWVRTQQQRNQVLITVADNGQGISDSIKEKIFQPFFTTKPTGQGTGLGLSLAYDIVKAHGGEINLESKEGQGTSFTIHLKTTSITA